MRSWNSNSNELGHLLAAESVPLRLPLVDKSRELQRHGSGRATKKTRRMTNGRREEFVPEKTNRSSAWQLSSAESKFSAKPQIDECCEELKSLREQLKHVANQVEAQEGTAGTCTKDSPLGLSCTTLKCRVEKCRRAVEALRRRVRAPPSMFFIGEPPVYNDIGDDPPNRYIGDRPQRYNIGDKRSSYAAPARSPPTPWGEPLSPRHWLDEHANGGGQR